MKNKETNVIVFNTDFFVRVAVNKEDIDVLKQYFNGKKIVWSLITKNGYPYFTYRCYLKNATIIYLEIRELGQIAIDNAVFYNQTKDTGWHRDEDGQWHKHLNLN